jgi:hypothetical protein
MPCFRSVYDLEQSLADAGLRTESRDIAATLRPVILFRRRQIADASLPVGTSKVGGEPDLPADFVWPQRPPLIDADRRAQLMEERGIESAEMLKRMRRDQPDLIRPEQIARIIEKCRGMAAALHLPMPLAFVAQLDLGGLVAEAGFPEDFPDTGLLSIFSDATSPGLAVHWHDRPHAELRRRPWPQPLIDYSDRFNERADWADDQGKWHKNADAEMLMPFSALAVPHHWKSAFPRSSATARKISDWFDNPGREYGIILMRKGEEEGGAPTGDFGDRFGGWPSDIQRHVETDVDGSALRAPGSTPWRHIFSWGAEHWQGTRCMSVGAGDGANYVLMREDDLHARRFDRIKGAYQQT